MAPVRKLRWAAAVTTAGALGLAALPAQAFIDGGVAGGFAGLFLRGVGLLLLMALAAAFVLARREPSWIRQLLVISLTFGVMATAAAALALGPLALIAGLLVCLASFAVLGAGMALVALLPSPVSPEPQAEVPPPAAPSSDAPPHRP